MWFATRARLLPAAASSAIRVSRTFTMANSAKTKKALTKTSTNDADDLERGGIHRRLTRKPGNG